MISCNIEGLIPRKFKGKLKMISELASEEESLIVALTESHLHENIKDAEVRISNYTSFRTDRANRRKKGGIITYVKDTVSPYTKVLLSFSNSVTEVQMLKIEHLNLVIIVIYRPPACTQNNFTQILAMIKDKLNEMPAPLPNIVLMGDLNLPIIDWASEEIRGGTMDARMQATALLDLAENYCMNQYIRVPTRGKNTLDIFLTNNEELVHAYRVDQTTMSDHNIIIISTNIKQLDTKIVINPLEGELTLNHLNFFSGNTNWENIEGELGELNWDKLIGDNPKNQYNMILKYCLEICKKYTPLKRGAPTKQNVPRDRKIIMRKRRRLRKKITYSTSDHNRTLMHKKIFKLEMDLKTSIDNEMKLRESQAVSAIKSNPKYFFKYASNKSKIKAAIGPLTRDTGEKIKEPIKICDALRKQYETVFSTPCEDKVITDPEQFFSNTNILPTIQDITFTRMDIVGAIKEIPTNAAAGPDGFPAILLKKTAEKLCVPLQILYRSSLTSGIIPEILKSAKITPVFKGGSRDKAENYRPIALHLI